MAENKIYFDPEIPVPEGLVGAVVGSVDDERVPESEEPTDFEDVYDYGEDDDDEGDDISDENYLEAPSELVILSQTVRTAPDGTQVVDVVVEIEDTGASDYQVRVTKV